MPAKNLCENWSGERDSVLIEENVERAFFSRSVFREERGPDARIYEDQIGVGH